MASGGEAVAESPARNPALAEQLFAQGKALLEKGDGAGACSAFTASQAADPSVGALLNVARCHEKDGKTATAWAEYRSAATLAAHHNDEERRRGAQDLADKLEPTLSRLSIEVSPQHAPVTVQVDAQSLPAMSHGLALPMDPGVHLVEASAAGYERWAEPVTLPPGGSKTTVLVPELSVRARRIRPTFVAGLVTGGLGVAALTVGGIEAARAMRMDHDLEARCAPLDPTNTRACGTAAQGDIDALKRTANLATILLAAGGAATAAGVGLAVTGWGDDDARPAEAKTGAIVTPVVAPTFVGATLGGRF